MAPPVSSEPQGSSTRPYLIRALHDWCTDNGFTPYLAVFVDAGVRVPMEYVKNGEIVLNVGFEATSGLRIGNDAVEFKARFGGVARDIMVPVDHVIAIYARENGQGMAFPMPTDAAAVPDAEGPTQTVGESGGASVSSIHPPASLRLAATSEEEPPEIADGSGDDAPPPASPSTGRPALKRIK